VAAAKRVTSSTRAAATDAETETYEYQAEVHRLMDLIVNSLYSNKDVFLRELVSNASDACDKLRFVSLSEPNAMAGNEELKIKIRGDEASKTLVIEDTGIGMSKEDLVSSLGTIARSGTAKFMEMLKSQSDGENLIGKFGVGFYSAFLVADKITVTSKNHTDDKTWTWESEINANSYTIRESEEPMTRGTKIVLHLKEGCEEFATGEKLSSLVKTYSEFISFPIDVWSKQTKEKQVEDKESTAKLKEAWEKKKIEAEAKGEEFSEPEPKPVMKKEFEQVEEWATANNDKPIWVRSPKDVEQEAYNDFFKSTFKEFLDPLAHSHFAVEGDIEFRSILFVPGMAPFEQQDMMAKSKAIKLFVRRVFISDEFDESLLPRYLTFVRGVVDSSDLPLNVSREILQESRIVRVIRKRLIRKTFDMLREIADRDNEDYATFWDNFGRNLKLGVIEDSDNRKDLAELLRFTTSKSGDEGTLRSLDQYVNDMPEEQNSIYFVAADNKDAAEASPFLEKLKKKGFEVLYLLDPIDEVAMANLATFKEKQIVDASKEALDLGEESEDEKKKQEELAAEFKGLTDWMKEVLGEQVQKVEVSNRLTDTPCVLVTSKFGWSANMERIMKAQAMGDNRAQDYMKGKKTMEINPSSPVIAQLKKLKESGASEAKENCQLLFDTALLTSGFSIEKPSVFASRVFKLMTAQASAAESSGDNDGDAVTPEIV
jgi:heat shock protein beta